MDLGAPLLDDQTLYLLMIIKRSIMSSKRLAVSPNFRMLRVDYGVCVTTCVVFCLQVQQGRAEEALEDFEKVWLG